MPDGACFATDAAPDSVGRLQLEKRLNALSNVLLAYDSATIALERWCRENGLPPNASVTATVLAVTAGEPTAEQRARLRIGGAEPVCQRRVRLSYDGHVLSEAENSYVPDRLTPAMRRRLDRTAVPFGRVVRALRFRRHRLDVERFWPPPAEPADDRASPPVVLRHRALLLRWDGLPFSEVVEAYTREALFLSLVP